MKPIKILIYADPKRVKQWELSPSSFLAGLGGVALVSIAALGLLVLSAGQGLGVLGFYIGDQGATAAVQNRAIETLADAPLADAVTACKTEDMEPAQAAPIELSPTDAQAASGLNLVTDKLAGDWPEEHSPASLGVDVAPLTQADSQVRVDLTLSRLEGSSGQRRGLLTAEAVFRTAAGDTILRQYGTAVPFSYRNLVAKALVLPMPEFAEQVDQVIVTMTRDDLAEPAIFRLQP